MTGILNALLMAKAPSVAPGQHPAADFCANLTIGGYTDWYMPAVRELEICYYNLKPTTDSNNTQYGINTYAVPQRTSSYTASVPGQTSAAAFQVGNSEAFNSGFGADYYWNSTQSFAEAGSIIGFINGQVYFGYKTSTALVRAIRKVAVSPAPPSPPTVIGQSFQGGFYAGQISTTANGVADYYLIVAPKATGQTTLQWKTTDTDSPGTTSVFNGEANTLAMV